MSKQNLVDITDLPDIDRAFLEEFALLCARYPADLVKSYVLARGFVGISPQERAGFVELNLTAAAGCCVIGIDANGRVICLRSCP